MGETDTAARALVVDDDPAIRVLVKKFIEREGFAVDTAENGFVALRMIGEREYDVVLLDLMMPNLDGFGVMSRLKAISPEMLERIVVMTALSHELIRERLPRVLKKPFDFRQLTRTVRGFRSARAS